MFFIVRYFGFLKSVPLLPHVFESMMKIWTLIFHPALLDCFDGIAAEVLTWHDVSASIHKYGGMQFNYNGKEIGHIHGNGVLDVPLNLRMKSQLMTEGRISHHHVFRETGWVSFYITRAEDRGYALKLIRMCYEMRVRRTPVERY